jgi:hypothetical protein
LRNLKRKEWALSENTITQIKEFFNSEEKPLKTAEVMEFWKSLSDEEKEYYKHAELE